MIVNFALTTHMAITLLYFSMIQYYHITVINEKLDDGEKLDFQQNLSLSCEISYLYMYLKFFSILSLKICVIE